MREESKSHRFKLWEIALCIGLVLAFTVSVLAADSGLSDKLIRLHVVGASDSEEDQALKLLVRDETLALTEDALAGAGVAGEAEEVIRANIPMLTERLNLFLRERGSGQTVTVTLGREAFPTREYSTFSLPAGPYTALRVVLGEGNGKNWWCVVFPPLCASAAIETLPGQSKAAGLTDDDISLITKDGEKYEIRFKLAEWFGNLKNWLFGE
ncbi:MAG: stage II sporulation protein R [Oscillospiraceae bacterium]|nr:stage II sporulation protein R [Oscillospiraceae bacterium]